MSAKYIISISAKNERYCCKKLNKFLQTLFLDLFREEKSCLLPENPVSICFKQSVGVKTE
jgi:hypothetical protein